MRSRCLVSLAVFILAVLFVSPVGAVVVCGTPVDNGGGQVLITVTSAGFTSVGAAVLSGPVTETGVTSDVGAPACNTSPPAQQDHSCSFTLQGTPGGGAQSWSRTFDDGSGATVCTVTEAEGLPVELVRFAIE